MAKKAQNKKQEGVNDNVGRYLLSDEAPHDPQAVHRALQQVPLTLQPFFKEQIDLNKELVRRFPNMPLMSVARFRDLYKTGERGVATLASQDGSSSLIVDVSKQTNEIQFSFLYGSMLALRFRLDELSDLDRQTWLENIENRVDEIAFLWGQSRWAKDYVICVPHRYYMSLLAFSPNNFEAAVRITPAASDALFEWLGTLWQPDEPDTDDSAGDGDASSILSGW